MPPGTSVILRRDGTLVLVADEGANEAVQMQEALHREKMAIDADSTAKELWHADIHDDTDVEALERTFEKNPGRRKTDVEVPKDVPVETPGCCAALFRVFCLELRASMACCCCCCEGDAEKEVVPGFDGPSIVVLDVLDLRRAPSVVPEFREAGHSVSAPRGVVDLLGPRLDPSVAFVPTRPLRRSQVAPAEVAGSGSVGGSGVLDDDDAAVQRRRPTRAKSRGVLPSDSPPVHLGIAVRDPDRLVRAIQRYQRAIQRLESENSPEKAQELRQIFVSHPPKP